jgi:hypothetical protein
MEDGRAEWGEPTPYFVLRLEGGEHGFSVVLSRLCGASLKVGRKTVFKEVDALVGAERGSGVAERAEYFGLLHRGLYSMRGGLDCERAECECSVKDGVCGRCRAVSHNERLFVWRECFDGLFPMGKGHWFSGVSDACGSVGAAGLPWLMCWDSVV